MVELEDLRAVGWTGPIWRIVHHPADVAPTTGDLDMGDLTGFYRRRGLLGADGTFPSATPSVPHDVSGLWEGLGIRVECTPIPDPEMAKMTASGSGGTQTNWRAMSAPKSSPDWTSGGR